MVALTAILGRNTTEARERDRGGRRKKQQRKEEEKILIVNEKDGGEATKEDQIGRTQ